MNRHLLSLLLAGWIGIAGADAEANKRIAREFYEDLWFSQNTNRYAEYVADEYVVHDIGERKGVTEPAIEQKRIADFFWSIGDMSGDIDYQIAEGDLVATRWQLRHRPDTLKGHLMFGPTDIPIINVFRFDDGKIVEIWNHRHDIDTGMTRIHLLKGFAAGVALAALIAGGAWLLRRRRRAS